MDPEQYISGEHHCHLHAGDHRHCHLGVARGHGGGRYRAPPQYHHQTNREQETPQGPTACGHFHTLLKIVQGLEGSILVSGAEEDDGNPPADNVWHL